MLDYKRCFALQKFWKISKSLALNFMQTISARIEENVEKAVKTFSTF
jgi:hypothetical protein